MELMEPGVVAVAARVALMLMVETAVQAVVVTS